MTWWKKSYLPTDNLDNENTESTHVSGPCLLYATIYERATGATVNVCRGVRRRRHVYTSTTNSVEIHFDEQIGNEMGVSYFTMEYGGIFIKILRMSRFYDISCYICSPIVLMIVVLTKHTRVLKHIRRVPFCILLINFIWSDLSITAYLLYFCQHLGARIPKYQTMHAVYLLYFRQHLGVWTPKYQTMLIYIEMGITRPLVV